MEKNAAFAFALTLALIVAGAVSALKPVRPAKAAPASAAAMSIADLSATTGAAFEIRADMF